MLKKGFKVAHFMTSHKHGTIVEIYNKQDNNNMTTGGTMSARSYVVVKFSDNTQITYNSGDVIRVYD
jgi:hypothetical protein